MTAATSIASALESCFHCGLAVEPGRDYSVVIDGVGRPMCCPGCRAVATAIIDQGLGEDFFSQRNLKRPVR